MPPQDGLRLNHLEAEIVLLGPEERNGVKSFALAQYIARSSLPLPLGDDKVFDPDALTGKSVWPARDIASSKDARGARLKVLIYSDTTVHGQPRSRRKRGLRPHPDTDDDEIGLEFISVLQRDALLVYQRGCRTKMKRHPIILMELADKLSDIRSEDPLHRNRFAPDHMHINVPGAKRCCHFKSDEACADHHGSPRCQSFGDKGATVCHCAEIIDVRELGAGHIETHRLSAGGEKEGAEGMSSAIRHLDLPVVNIDRSDASAKVQVDYCADRSRLDSADATPARYPFDKLGRSQGSESSALNIVTWPE
jgi:hypothetical protein